jgi:hypothetical protein
MVKGWIAKHNGHRVNWVVVVVTIVQEKAQCQSSRSLPKVLPTKKLECSYGLKMPRNLIFPMLGIVERK